jgi:hypothetical protein
MYPIIKTSGTRFVLVKDGEEKMVRTLELKVVVLRAKQGFEKRFYAKKYDPNSSEAAAPDCYSLDGDKPAANCSNPQNTACAGCKWNQFGTGTDQNGHPGKGKACADRKVLAVLYPNPDTKTLDVYGLSLPPASLKAFAGYVKTLTTNQIPLPAAFTTIGFDEKSSYPVMSFNYGGTMDEKALGQVIPMIESAEVKAIIDADLPVVSPVAPIAAAKEEAGGFGFETEEVVVEAPKAAKALKSVKKAEPVIEATPAVEESEEDLIAMLGIEV